jgi:hypothetical protein
MATTVMSDEGRALLSRLDGQREHVLGILEGLPEEDLRRAVLPSGWTCLGLVQHLAVDVERFWFRQVMAGETEGRPPPEQDALAAWNVSPDVPAGEVFAQYRREAELASAVIAATPMDAEPAWWPEWFGGGWRLASLRELTLHVIAETACHAGHLDVVRELIDGRR